MTTKKKVILTSITIVVLALATYLITQKPFSAFEEPASKNRPASSLLTLSITENGQRLSGEVYISGDCPNQVITGQTGNFSCLLNGSSEPGHKLTLLSYHSAVSKKTYNLPIKSAGIDSLILEPGQTISLAAQITNGQVKLREYNGNTLIDVNPLVGLTQHLVAPGK